jgi:excisionase family DNA binding protein
MKSDIGTFEVVLRPQQVAAMLQVTTKTLAQWRYQRRHLPFHKFGSSVRYRLEDVQRFLQDRIIRCD